MFWKVDKYFAIFQMVDSTELIAAGPFNDTLTTTAWLAGLKIGGHKPVWIVSDLLPYGNIRRISPGLDALLAPTTPIIDSKSVGKRSIKKKAKDGKHKSTKRSGDPVA